MNESTYKDLFQIKQQVLSNLLCHSNISLLNWFLLPSVIFDPCFLIFHKTSPCIIRSSRYTAIGVSHTTRPKTMNEVDHEAYHFVTIDEFRDLLKQGKFLSVIEFLGNCFGFGTKQLSHIFFQIQSLFAFS